MKPLIAAIPSRKGVAMNCMTCTGLNITHSFCGSLGAGIESGMKLL
jgi:hypothetical protein